MCFMVLFHHNNPVIIKKKFTYTSFLFRFSVFFYYIKLANWKWEMLKKNNKKNILSMFI